MKTKLITLIIFVFLLTSCSCTTRENTGRKENTGIQPRFKVGDVVYLKPDSIKAVIEEVNKCGCLGKRPVEYEYRLYYYSRNGEKHIAMFGGLNNQR